MTELFNLAAQVKLSRRLKNLLRIDENIKIDTSYVTCAEYQLFIDQKRISGKNVQPDHWTADRFLPGTAKTPITGTRISDAEEFCQWLTQQYPIPGIQYRLPTIVEVQENPIFPKQVGCWCKDTENRVVVADIESGQWDIWQKALTEFRYFDLELDLDPVLGTYLSLDLKLYLARIRAHPLNLNCSLDLTRALDLVLDLVRDLVRTLSRTRGLVDSFVRDLGRALKLALTLAHALDLDLDLALDLTNASDLNLVRVSDLNLARIPNLEKDYRIIRSYLLLIFLLWALLANIYEQASKKTRKIWRTHHLTHGKCDALIRNCITKENECFDLYTFFLLIDLRREGKMPAWEGIRIVRERVDS